jgi:AcrR family transcriptional regulator
MSATTGRREVRKLATKAALLKSAARLFAEQGYEATTVRDIARDAGVGERTFYRYFASKEDLLAGQALAWIGVLSETIRHRPAPESAYQAVAGAVLAVARQSAADASPAALWALMGQPQSIALLRRAAPRPLRFLEDAIAAAVRDRLRAAPGLGSQRPGTADPELQAQLLARTAVAVLRTAAIRHRQLQTQGGTGSPGIEPLLQDAFTTLSTLTRT